MATREQGKRPALPPQDATPLSPAVFDARPPTYAARVEPGAKTSDYDVSPALRRLARRLAAAKEK